MAVSLRQHTAPVLEHPQVLLNGRASAHVDGVRADAVGSHAVDDKGTEGKHPHEELLATKGSQVVGKLQKGLRCWHEQVAARTQYRPSGSLTRQGPGFPGD